MKSIALFFITVYRLAISPLMPPHCRFYPTCSCYAEEAIQRYGIARGSLLTLRRLAKCHPWHPGGFDPVPACSPSCNGADNHNHSTDRT